MKKSLKAILIISVLFNLLLAGVILGHAGRYYFKDGRNSQYKELVAKLPADKQKIYQDAINKAQEDSAELHEKFDEARKQAGNLLRAEKFDRDAYLAQIKTMHDLRGQIMQKIANAVADIAGQFTPQERAILADIFRKSGAPWRSRKADDNKQEEKRPD